MSLLKLIPSFVPTSSGPYTTVLCSIVTSPVTLTSKLTVTSTNAVDVTCRSGSGDINTTRLTVAGSYISYVSRY